MIENIGAYSQVDYDRGYQQGRVDILREHREQCQGKCLKCEVSAHFIDADGEEVKLPYDYSYKTDCEDTRYINAKEVLSLINRARADAIDKCAKVVSSMVGICQYSCPIGCEWGTEESCVESWKTYLTEQLKEQI